MNELKEKLINACRQLVAERLATIQLTISELQEAANSETKSSAGDKYETGRAMAQLEIEKQMQQLAEATRQKHTLDTLRVHDAGNAVKPGSVVITNQGNYFISVGLGRMAIDDETFIALSAISPLGSLLLHKQAGESFTFNKQHFTITSIY